METIIENEYNGLLVSEDQAEIDKKALEILKDDKKRQLLGENALKTDKEKFWTWEQRMSKEVEEVKKLKGN